MELNGRDITASELAILHESHNKPFQCWRWDEDQSCLSHYPSPDSGTDDYDYYILARDFQTVEQLVWRLSHMEAKDWITKTDLVVLAIRFLERAQAKSSK